MFISRKRWNQMERRVAALEKICRPDVSPLSCMKEALSKATESNMRSAPIHIEIDPKTFAKLASNIHPNTFRSEDSDGFRDSGGTHTARFRTPAPKYKTERIENLDELEAIHRNLYTAACNLHDELDEDAPNMEYVNLLAKSIHMEAHKAIDFEFIVTQRTVKDV